ncbi:hypothetical protein [uncultured Duncaniella sp.]|uniref:hypothetical protein n=1 Tax=uncultured Duncaniella sp. TaxID=2768039 RepID=UPI00272BB49E|nr:hypothetical protein [uncultured Duncaniella sp.]
MRKLRKCNTAQLNTGISKCPPDFENMKGAILVSPGTKLPSDLTADKLESLVHAERPDRVYGIIRFTEYAKNGGEVQTSANDYDGETPTGVSARKDTFTLNKFYPELLAALTGTYNQHWDVYFFDDNNMLFGLNDGTDVLAGYPMTSVYGDSTPFNTSSAKASMTVTFAHENAKRAFTDFDYVQLDFNPQKLVLGLTPVRLEKTGTAGNSYKIFEKTGGYDVTAIYGPLIVTAGDTVVEGATTAITYNAGTETLTIASSSGADIRLKSPAVLYENDIKGIEQVA